MKLLDRLREDGWEGDFESMPYNFNTPNHDEPLEVWAKIILYGDSWGCNADIYVGENDNAANCEELHRVFSGVILDEDFLDDLYESLLIYAPERPHNKIKFDPRLN